jgi:hypothetical protein
MELDLGAFLERLKSARTCPGFGCCIVSALLEVYSSRQSQLFLLDFHGDTRITDGPCLVSCRLRAVEFHRCFRSSGPCCVPEAVITGNHDSLPTGQGEVFRRRPNLLDNMWAFSVEVCTIHSI